MTDLLYKDEVYKIIGAAMEVHRVLGHGFLEAVYQEALAIEFRLRDIPFIEQPQLNLDYKGHPLEAFYRPDYLCYEEIIVEIKAMSKCGTNEEGQIINALNSSRKKVGVLISVDPGSTPKMSLRALFSEAISLVRHEIASANNASQ